MPLGATGNIARPEQRFLCELSLPFPCHFLSSPYLPSRPSIARISIISSMISQTWRVNRILFAIFNQPFRNCPCFQYREWWPSWTSMVVFILLFPPFYSSPSILNILPSRQRLHRSRYFARITISPDSLFAVETDRNTAFYEVIFVQVPWCFRPRMKAIFCTDCKNVSS